MLSSQNRPKNGMPFWIRYTYLQINSIILFVDMLTDQRGRKITFYYLFTNPSSFSNNSWRYKTFKHYVES